MHFDNNQMRRKLFELLGDMPEKTPIECTTLDIEDKGSYILETLSLDLNGIEKVPAYLVRPKEPPKNNREKYPVVLYNHAHGGAYELGKKELIKGAPWIYNEPYANFLTRNGYAALCIDMWCFGERNGISEREQFKQMLFNGRVLLGMMLYDNIRAIDYLETRESFDMSSLTVIGTSMGGVISQWTAALDERVKNCISMCSMFDVEELVKTNQLGRHNMYYTIPNFLKEGFSTAKVNSLIAPRAHFNFSGKYDTLAPVSAMERIKSEVLETYKQYNKEDNFKLFICDCGHYETSYMRAEIRKLLDRYFVD